MRTPYGRWRRAPAEAPHGIHAGTIAAFARDTTTPRRRSLGGRSHPWTTHGQGCCGCGRSDRCRGGRHAFARGPAAKIRSKAARWQQDALTPDGQVQRESFERHVTHRGTGGRACVNLRRGGRRLAAGFRIAFPARESSAVEMGRPREATIAWISGAAIALGRGVARPLRVCTLASLSYASVCINMHCFY